MNLFDYHWDKIGWKGFEEMCLYLAECTMPERRFELYGRQGEEQDGIDILSKNERGEEVICIQCKRYEEMSLTNLKKIVKAFEEKDFRNTAQTFILATRASLTAKNLLAHINKEKLRFKKEYKISFETWDVNYIEKELSNQYTLTSKYFGLQVADTIWSGKVNIPTSYQPVDHYISRSVIPYKEGDDASHFKWVFGRREQMNLTDLFTGYLPYAKKYCLLADAYEGKTTLLRQLAYELYYNPLKLKPVFLQLKDHGHRSLTETLDMNYRWWRSIPIKELVIMVDGLDEVDAGRFQESVKYIHEFTNQFPSVALIFSCRKLFFHQNQVQKLIPEFSFYELYPLQIGQVDKYISMNLPGLEMPFRSHISTYDLDHFLFHPFYLRSLVKIFREDRARLPKSRVTTIEYFINESFNEQSARLLASGSILKRKEKKYRDNLTKIAFIMQLKGQNTLEEQDVQEFFTENEDTELLKMSSILTFSQEKWSFQNAIFQEYLSALVLEKLSFDNIINIVCVGDQIKKVKTKWIQTLVGVLSLLSKEDERREKIYELIQKDNIELVTMVDGQQLPISERLKVLQLLLNRYESTGLWPMVAHEDTIGKFFRGMPEAERLLMHFLHTSPIIHVKRIACRILQFIDLSSSEFPALLALAKTEISGNPDMSYVEEILEMLIRYRIGSRDFIDFLIAQPTLNSQLRYRNQVYDMLVLLELSEEYYDYAIEGVKIMLSTPTDNLMRTGHALEQILLRAQTRKSVEKLFAAISSDEWVTFRTHNCNSDDSFVQEVTNLCTNLYQNDRLVLLSVTRFIRDLGYKHLKDEFKKIDQFFFNTNTTGFPIRYFLHLPGEGTRWQIGDLITEDSFGFIFAYYDEGYISGDDLLRLNRNVSHSTSRDLFLKFNNLYLGATGNDDAYQAQMQQQTERQRYEELKKENDLIYIRDQEAFTKGILNYFKAYGKKTIPENDIIIDYDEARKARKDVDSFFVANFIVYQIRNKKGATLSHCLKAIEDKNYFDFFRIHELLNYTWIQTPEKEPLRLLLKQLFDDQIGQAKFETAISENGQEVHVSNFELLLTQVFRKMEFPTEPEILIQMLCMDIEGIDNFRTSKFSIDKRPSLSEQILNKLTPHQLTIASKTVLQRLQNGIAVQDILENHIALCRKLHMTESVSLILSYMKTGKVRSYNLYTALEIYLELGGELERAVPLLDDFTDFDVRAYYLLMIKFKEDYPQNVIHSLLKAMMCTTVSMDKRLDFAQLLIELGETRGLLFIIDQMQGVSHLPWGRGDQFNFKKIDTTFVLEQLHPFLPALLMQQDAPGFRKNVKSIVVDFLFALALKGEKDMLKVDQYLRKAESDILQDSGHVSYIAHYREQILENFRDTISGHHSIEEAIEIFGNLEPLLSKHYSRK